MPHAASHHALQDVQANFVVRCIQHLQLVHSSRDARERPFRLVLVAYSMGGVVARAALRQLAADPAFGELACTACRRPGVAGPCPGLLRHAFEHCIAARKSQLGSSGRRTHGPPHPASRCGCLQTWGSWWRWSHWGLPTTSLNTCRTRLWLGS